MSRVLSEIGGLHVVTDATTDEDAVRRGLKQIDDRYMLDSIPGPYGMVWIVLCRTGSETPPLPVLNWVDEQSRPLPLTYALVEKVKRLRADSRWREPDAHELNEKLREKTQAELDDYIDEIVKKHSNRELRFFMGDLTLNKRAIGVARRRGRDNGRLYE